MKDSPNPTGAKSNKVNRLKNAFSSLDSKRVHYSYLARNVALRVLVVVYLINEFLYSSDIVVATIVFSLSSMTVMQTYLLMKFWRDAKINSLQEWKLLFTHQSRFSKILFGVAVGFIVLLLIPLLLTEIRPFTLRTVLTIVLFGVICMSSVTDVILQPLVRDKFTNLLTTPEQEVLQEADSNAMNDEKYRQLALTVLNSDGSVTGGLELSEEQQLAVQNAMEAKQNHDQQRHEQDSGTASINNSDQSLQELWASAEQKLEEVDDDNSGTNTAALSAAELEVLTDAEVEAILLREKYDLEESEEPFQRTKRRLRGR